MLRILVLAAAGVVALTFNPAGALALSCPSGGGTGIVYTVDNASACTTGNGKINQNSDITIPGHTALDKTGADDQGVASWNGALTISGNTFQITPPTGSPYQGFVLLLQQNAAQDPSADQTPQYAWFTLTALTGTWAIEKLGSSEPATLSHAWLFGCTGGPFCTSISIDPPSVPLPGALLLFGTVVAGGFGLGKLRQKRTGLSPQTV